MKIRAAAASVRGTKMAGAWPRDAFAGRGIPMACASKPE